MNFEEHLYKYLNKDEIKKLIDSLSLKEEKSVYLNTLKMTENEFLKHFPNVKKHPVVKNGYLYDKNEYELGKTIYHELGCFYIQEPSAMLVANFLDAKPSDIVLDLCAAPGGKTIQTAIKMNNQGMIIANDLSKERANVLLSNIERLGISNTVVTSLDFETQYDKFINYFDKIIIDAPCSGSGMFRKSEEMKNDWSYEKVLKNAAIQKKLILLGYKMLKPGGTMIYSTCSYSFEENEEVIEHFLKNTNGILFPIPSFNGEYRSPKFKETVHLFPSHFQGEGHYIAIIKKPGELTENKFEKVQFIRKENGKGSLPQTEIFQLNHSLPKNFEKLCLRPGLLLETKIKDKSIPSHHFARCENNLIKLNVGLFNLLGFLNGATFIESVPDGYYCIRYENYNVGVCHVVDSVVKNLYPKGLRKNSFVKS